MNDEFTKIQKFIRYVYECLMEEHRQATRLEYNNYQAFSTVVMRIPSYLAMQDTNEDLLELLYEL